MSWSANATSNPSRPIASTRRLPTTTSGWKARAYVRRMDARPDRLGNAGTLTVIANAAKPRLTVIVPALNAAPTIEVQLASLLVQDYPEPWEIVVIDNGSHDDTAAIVQSWFGRLTNLRLVECATVGANRARNAGVRAAGETS